MSTPDVRMRGFGKRAALADVEAMIASRVSPLGTERVSFRAALGRVLAEDITSDRDLPPHPRSAMDGYAVRAADVPGTLEVVGELTAAETSPGPLPPGKAVRIMTGAAVPEGADAVVMVEDSRLEGGRVHLAHPARPGQHVLATGEDLRAGQAVLARGRRLGPEDVSMLASLGVLEVTVIRRPRVRIVPSGNELVRVGAAARTGQVIESNSYLLEGLALRDGAEPTLHPIVPDDLELLRRAFLEPGADVIVSTGGSSVGKEDFPPVVVRELGELAVHGVDVKPASPSGIGFIDGAIVVLAPGYPVASYVAWDLFVRPIVQRLAGLPVVMPYRTVRATLTKKLVKPASRVELPRVTLAQGTGPLPVATVLPGGAALLSTVVHASGFLVIPAGVEELPAGSEVEVRLYRADG